MIRQFKIVTRARVLHQSVLGLLASDGKGEWIPRMPGRNQRVHFVIDP